MEIEVVENRVTIKGNIKSIADQQKIKSVIDGIAGSYRSINLDIVDSMSMTSSVIGYFNKIALKDGIKISMSVGNRQLYALLDELGLVDVFNIVKK